MTLFARLAPALLSGLALSTFAAPARADAAGAPEPPRCRATLLSVDFSLPSSAPALVLHEGTSSGLTATVTAELVSATGDRSPLAAPTRDARGLTIMKLPNAPAGSYTLTTKVACSNGDPEQTESVSLTLTAPVAFPKTVGTLSVRPSSDHKGMETIVVEPTAELRAFNPIAVVELTLNGEKAPIPLGPSFELAAHTGSVCVENGALIRDKRTIKAVVSAYLVGVADAPAPATLDLVVDCGAIEWTSESDFKKPSTPGTSPTEPTSAVAGSSAGGCSAAPSSVPSGGGVAGTLVALALLGWRRRRGEASLALLARLTHTARR